MSGCKCIAKEKHLRLNTHDGEHTRINGSLYQDFAGKDQAAEL